MPEEKDGPIRTDGYREGEESAAEFEHAREMLHNAMTLTGLGIWTWNLTTLAVELSDEIFAIIRQDPASFDGSVDYLFERVLHPSSRKLFSEVLHEITVGEPVGRREFRIIRGDGSDGWICFSGSIVRRLETGDRVAVGSIRDITDERLHEQQFQEQVRLLETLLGTMPNPVFFKDSQGIYRFCNEAFLQILGLSRDEVVGHTVHGVAASALAKVYAQSDAELMATGGSQMYESQIRSSAGAVRDVVFNKAVVKAHDGTPLGIVGVVQDVTERKATEQHLRMLHQVKDVMLRMSHDLLGYPDLATFFEDLLKRLLELYQDCAQGSVLEIAESEDMRILRAIGYDAEEAGRFTFPLREGYNWQLTQGRMDNVVLIGDIDAVQSAISTALLRNNRGERICSLLSIPVSDGEKVHWIISLDSTRKDRFTREDRLVAEYLREEIPILIRMFHLHARTLILSRTDPLTGLINRGYCEAILDDRIRTARRNGTSLQVAMIDMDGLKRVNDQYSHQAGDNYLLALARLFEQSVRSSDVVARIGGDEFLLVFSDTARAHAARIMGDIRTRFEGMAFHFNGATFTGSFSYGIATLHEDGDARETLMLVADRRMYEDKGMRRRQRG